MQKSNLVNIISFSLSSPKRAVVLVGKLCLRFFDKKGSFSSQQNMAWIKQSCQDFQTVFNSIDPQLWKESLEFSAQLKTRANAILLAAGHQIGGGGIYPMLYFLTRHKKPRVVVETGVAAGFSSQAFLKAMQKNGQGVLYSSDLPYFRLKNPEQYIGIVVDNDLKKSWRLFIEGDKANITAIKKEAKIVDLFHYDSDKSYRAREYALKNLEPLFIKDAIVMFDDIQDNSHFHDYVTESNIKNFQIFEFEKKYIGIVGNF